MATLAEHIAKGSIIFDVKKPHLKTELLEHTDRVVRDFVADLADAVTPVRISSVTTGTHENKESRHYVGRAVDIGNEELAAGFLAFADRAADKYAFDEIIFDRGLLGANGSLKERNVGNLKGGKAYEYTNETLNKHKDHVHFSFKAYVGDAEVRGAAVVANKEDAPATPQSPFQTAFAAIGTSAVREGSDVLASVDPSALSDPSHLTSTLVGLAEGGAIPSSSAGPEPESSESAAMDSEWVERRDEVTAVTLDVLSTSTKSPAVAIAATKAITTYLEADHAADVASIAKSFGPALGALLQEPAEAITGKLGLTPGSSKLLTDYFLDRGNSGDPVDLGLNILRNEVSQHIPSEFKPIADMAFALLGGDQEGIGGVARTVFSGQNSIASATNLLSAGAIGPGVAVMGAAAAGFAIYSMVEQNKSNRKIMAALQQIQRDLTEIKKGIADLKAAVDAFRDEFRGFAQETRESLKQIMDLLERGINAILADTAQIRRELTDVRRALGDAVAKIDSLRLHSEVALDATMKADRDSVRRSFAEKIFTAFRTYRPPVARIPDADPFDFRDHLAFFFTHATVTSFSASMARSFFESSPTVERLLSSVSVEQRAEYQFGLLPELVAVVSKDIGDYKMRSLPHVPDGLPNPVEFVRGADVFLQLLALAPFQTRVEHIGSLETLIEIAERIRRFVANLRSHYEDGGALRRVEWALERRIADVCGRYRTQLDLNPNARIHSTKYKISAEIGHGTSMGHFSDGTYCTSSGIDDAAIAFSPSVQGLRFRIEPILSYLLSIKLLEEIPLEPAPTIDARDVPTLKWAWSFSRYGEDYDYSARLSKVRLRVGGDWREFLWVRYKPKFYKDTHAFYLLTDINDLPNARLRTDEFLQAAGDAASAWNKRHWEELLSEIRAELTATEVDDWSTMHRAYLLVDRVRLFSDVRHSDDAIRWLTDAAQGGVARTRADLEYLYSPENTIRDDDFNIPTYFAEKPAVPFIAFEDTLPLIDACVGRLRGFASNIDGSARWGTTGRGIEFTDPIAAVFGDYTPARMVREPHRRAHTSMWRYFKVTVPKDTKVKVDARGSAFVFDTSGIPIEGPTWNLPGADKTRDIVVAIPFGADGVSIGPAEPPPAAANWSFGDAGLS